MPDTGSVVVLAYDEAGRQIEVDVRFYHEESDAWYRLQTHTPKGGRLEVGWPLGWWSFHAEAPGYATLEGRRLLTSNTESWKLHLRTTKETPNA